MKHTALGNSDLQVSRVALGCMSFGDTSRGYNEWALDDEAAQPFFDRRSSWASISGTPPTSTASAPRRRSSAAPSRSTPAATRSWSATKLFFKMHDGPGGSGLSRTAIMEQIDASLARLGTDYIDLYQIHRFDPDTPVEETMEALHDVVTAGKARYLGASSMWAWQFAKMQHAADLNGWTRFVSMQDQYNLIQREEEREMFGLLADQGVGAIPWSPLAKGRLARPWGVHTTRSGKRPPRTDVRKRQRPPDRRGGPTRRRSPATPDGPDRSRLGAQESGRCRSHRRSNQASPPFRRRCRPRRRAHRRRDQSPRSVIHPSRANRLLRSTRPRIAG